MVVKDWDIKKYIFLQFWPRGHLTSCLQSSPCQAAAALGNTLSDMLGIGSAWYVESWADRLGAHPPDLSSDQLEMTWWDGTSSSGRFRVCLLSCRVAGNFGRAFGVVVGCIIGMFPLLFIGKKARELIGECADQWWLQEPLTITSHWVTTMTQESWHQFCESLR